MIRSLLFCASLLAGACVGVAADPAAPTAYTFSRSGDDGLTLRISEAIMTELETAPDFRPATVGELRTLLVAIPEHAQPGTWKAPTDAAVGLVLRWSDKAATASYGVSCPLDQPDACGRAALATIRQYVATSRSASSGSGDQ